MATTKYYCSTSDVYRQAGIGSSVVSTTNVTGFIQEAEAEVDAITQTTYWQLAHSSTAVSGTTASLDTTGLTADEHIGNVIKVTSGSSTEHRIVTDNTSTTVSVDRSWTTVPNSTSTYQIFHCGTPPYSHGTTDGDGQYTMYLDNYPLIDLESLTIDSTSVTPSYVYQYKDVGQITLKSSAEYSNFKADYQTVNSNYWFGVKDEYKNTVPLLVRKYVAIVAALMSLMYQIGGTYDDVTVFKLGPMEGSLGEPYTNIREAVLKLTLERDRILKKLTIYNHLY